MEPEIVINISRDTIKPSSPTPSHLRTYKLSILDQLIPPAHAGVTLYYRRAAYPPPQTSRLLKHALSETLTRFYPLAGTVSADGLSIDCHDSGAVYVESRVKCTLDDFLSQPGLAGKISELVPVDLRGGAGTPSELALVQASFFACGGVSIGACGSHRVMDAAALFSFVKAWAAAASSAAHGGSVETVTPIFTAPSLFPHNRSLPEGMTLTPWGKFIKQGNSVQKRFAFSGFAISSLKAEVAAAAYGGAYMTPPPSRVETVTALIWKCAMSASKAHGGRQRPSVIAQAVNFRRRTTPPSPEHSFGNQLWMASATYAPPPQPGECVDRLAEILWELAGEIRKGTARIDGGFVEALQGEEGFGRVCERVRELWAAFPDEAGYVVFTSLCGYGAFEVDFGWGRPVWAGLGGGGGGGAPVSMNVVCLMDSKWGGGIEAWVMLGEEEMFTFERDPHILAYASVEPNPLKLGYSLNSTL